MMKKYFLEEHRQQVNKDFTHGPFKSKTEAVAEAKKIRAAAVKFQKDINGDPAYVKRKFRIYSRSTRATKEQARLKREMEERF